MRNDRGRPAEEWKEPIMRKRKRIGEKLTDVGVGGRGGGILHNHIPCTHSLQVTHRTIGMASKLIFI
jgi:hypothetical protein